MGSLSRLVKMDTDILDVEVPCYICKEMVILGNDYRCHLNFAHEIFETENVDKFVNVANKRLNQIEITLEEDDDVEDQTFPKNGTYQCEVCGEVFKGREVVEAHIDNLHLDIVQELEETVADFYVLLPIVSKSTKGLLTSEDIGEIFEEDKKSRNNDINISTTLVLPGEGQLGLALLLQPVLKTRLLVSGR